MNEVLSRFGLSARRFCRLTGWNRSSLQYRPEGRDDAALRERLRYLAARKPRWGAPILPDVLKAEGLVINHKRTERLYREEGLSLRRKGRRKLPAVARVSLSVPQGPNERWSRDLIHDQLATGRRFRCLTLVNDFTRQCLAIHVDTSIGGISVVAVLQRLALSGRLPKAITVGQWSRVHRQSPPPLGSTLRRCSSSYPSGQTDAERFHRELQWYLARRLPHPHWFSSLAEARLLVEHWRSHDYNRIRPHFSLGHIPPDFFALNCLNQTPNTSPSINPAAA